MVSNQSFYLQHLFCTHSCHISSCYGNHQLKGKLDVYQGYISGPMVRTIRMVILLGNYDDAYSRLRRFSSSYIPIGHHSYFDRNGQLHGTCIQYQLCWNVNQQHSLSRSWKKQKLQNIQETSQKKQCFLRFIMEDKQLYRVIIQYQEKVQLWIIKHFRLKTA